MDQKQQIADRLKQANNVLVTVSNNPSVDQLASCIGLTLALNKMGKHATAVFSGVVPSTIEFLQPEKTIETNTDSLRDFIISLDKSKADKLRYKVEDKVVKIFITPYRTSISEKDLEFGQGDFNVDVVITLGVHDQGELDQAITSHGRILHDATIVSVNVKPGGELGSLNWLVPSASSLSELAFDLVDATDRSVVDQQIATALLAGIVAETERFSNAKTSPDTMSISAELMAAGANQQLVATKLAPPPPPAPAPQAPLAEAPAGDQPAAATGASKSPDGTLEINHITENISSSPAGISLGDDNGEDKPEDTPQIHIDDQGGLHNIEEMTSQEKNDQEASSTDPTQHMGGSRMILQPPSMGSSMSASGAASGAFGDPLSLPPPSDISSSEPSPDQSPFGGSPASATISAPPMPFMPSSMTPGAPPAPSNPLAQPNFAAPPQVGQTVVPVTPAAVGPNPGHVDNARSAVDQAISSSPQPSVLHPIHALNAQPLGDPLRTMPQPLSSAPPDLNVPAPAQAPQPAGLTMPAPVGAPPPVPPPLMPQG
jgi:hypothetical protein